MMQLSCGLRGLLAGWAIAIVAPMLLAAPAGAAKPPWPPATGPGVLFAHYGEEHWNDDDGLMLLPKVVEDTAAYKPNLVLQSADKASDGTVEELTKWREIMAPYDAKGIPYFAGVGNHDRDNLEGGLPPAGSLDNYMEVFKARHYPFGDGAPPTDPLFAPSSRPGEDPAGASSHYWLDYANVRWIVIDNSCYGIETPGADCDSMQNPPFPDQGTGGQYEFLKKFADEATAKGKLVFVQMHMPTQDPRRSHTNPTPFPHNMGEGLPFYNGENERFEENAEKAGIDGVFTAHIKGQWQYTARDIPYFIDGGAGGELYTNEPTGTGVDTGYWHGYRLVRVTGDGKFIIDTVPIFVPGGIKIAGPATVAKGKTEQYAATGKQPTDKGPKVEALELRDPDPKAPEGKSLPTPARIWTTGNRFVLAPVAAEQDDSRRDARSQTVSGKFRARCPGRTSLQIISGFESASARVTVPSAAGRIVRSISRGSRVVRRGRRAAVATVRLAQDAEVLVRVRRGKRTVRTLTRRCQSAARPLRALWDGRAARRRSLRAGSYSIEVSVRSDRKTVSRRFGVRLR